MRHDTTKSLQAARVIAKFGNARKLSRALAQLGDTSKHRSPSVIYRWTYSKERGGTDGRIPSNAIDDVIDAGRLEGILITTQDLYDRNGR